MGPLSGPVPGLRLASVTTIRLAPTVLRVDPGKALVTERLATPDEALPPECYQAVNVWYGAEVIT